MSSEELLSNIIPSKLGPRAVLGIAKCLFIVGISSNSFWNVICCGVGPDEELLISWKEPVGVAACPTQPEVRNLPFLAWMGNTCMSGGQTSIMSS